MPVIAPIPTADICDQHDPQAIAVVSPLFYDFGGIRRFAGRITTLHCADDNSKVRELLNQDGDGGVLVIDGGASYRCALLGGNLAALAEKNNWRGILINGCVRDSDELKQANIGIRALAALPRRSEKHDQGHINVPLNFANAAFIPGHFLYADHDGIVLSAHAL